ncbi:DUF3883 domain-containing protein [Arthrobacter sp. NEB 688]|uniref:DUF3883 domain-containing protein n=1 Tax=Arthrobacter sp. NEB 688 TaxID=904039 RepID=UPI00156716D0|nr:DUF3883 domain-containing protein [Arthrobacter sp. NEB 688]QKE84393.1 DUF3883 domain-containing protein [Arthrobacter sp. NEB 688]
MAQGWAESEVERTLDVYFAMLRRELRDETFPKVDYYRPLSREIGRSESAVQYKFSNVSAVLAELGATFVEGFKPLSNVQDLLRQRTSERFDNDPDLRQLLMRSASREPSKMLRQLGSPVDVPDDLVVPDRAAAFRSGVRIDYNALEASNAARGLAGELLVLDRERRVLTERGRRDLARKVRHSSVEDGDGLGFDIRSFTPDGEERFLEVKTTVRSARQPFYVSANEVEFSTEATDQFTLVRVFHLERHPGFYEMRGSLRESAELRPDSYVAWPRRRVAS